MQKGTERGRRGEREGRGELEEEGEEGIKEGREGRKGREEGSGGNGAGEREWGNSEKGMLKSVGGEEMWKGRGACERGRRDGDRRKEKEGTGDRESGDERREEEKGGERDL